MIRRRDTRTASAALGAVVYLAALPLPWWNEGAAVRDDAAIRELARTARDTSPEAPDPSLDGAAVVLSGGRAEAAAPLRNPVFGLEAEALRLRRTVEM